MQMPIRKMYPNGVLEFDVRTEFAYSQSAEYLNTYQVQVSVSLSSDEAARKLAHRITELLTKEADESA